METLVLNAFYVPVTVIHWQKAVVLWYKNKVEVLDSYERVVHSPSTAIKVPSVVRFMGKVNGKSKIVKFSKGMIYKRDRGRCQYCSIRVSKTKATLDHVVPKSKGGLTNWTNIVLACEKCNQLKRDRTPIEAKMHLHVQPVKPTAMPAPVLMVGMKRMGIPESWVPYIKDE